MSLRASLRIPTGAKAKSVRQSALFEVQGIGAMQRSDVLQALDSVLEPWRFKDYRPNGLQVEGRADIRRIVTGVTASAALLIDAAIALQADAILVHHGYFWKNEDPRVLGMKIPPGRLLAHDINLIAYHLPLDAHPTLGINATLARVLGITAGPGRRAKSAVARRAGPADASGRLG